MGVVVVICWVSKFRKVVLLSGHCVASSPANVFVSLAWLWWFVFFSSIAQEDALHSNILMELRVGARWLTGWAKKGADEEGAMVGQGKREGHYRFRSFLVPCLVFCVLFHFPAFIYLVNMLSWPRLLWQGIVTLAQLREQNLCFFLVCRERAAGRRGGGEC